jgi:sigma-E factor negative regulatory protein RseA
MKPPEPQTAVTSPDDERRELLSALVDGQPDAVDAAARQWREDPEARLNWHAYHLIGDVMRSDDLAHSPARDAAFMAGLRKRLAQEAVVLAPEPALALALAPVATIAPQDGRRWQMPVALLAGFAAVAGVLVVNRIGGAEMPASSGAIAAASSAQASPLAVRQLAVGQALITDPRLDEFLRAHQAAGGVMSVASPGGALRRVEVVVPAAAAR